jgi:type VI secretion system protein ImpL
MLRQFELAQRIRDTFFTAGSQMPQLRFMVVPFRLDAAASKFVLEIDGQTYAYQFGPERQYTATWPGTNPSAAATFEDRNGGRNVVRQGPWAWLRLVDDADVQQETDVRYLLTWKAGGHEASVRLDALSVRNPYMKTDLQQFRCGL